jgi:hypothetical protein
VPEGGAGQGNFLARVDAKRLDHFIEALYTGASILGGFVAPDLLLFQLPHRVGPGHWAIQGCPTRPRLLVGLWQDHALAWV